MKKKNRQLISLYVNGEEYDVVVYPNRTLLEVLREDLRLTGAKEGCDDGVCGACTVLIDGKPVRSCMLLAIEAEGKKITTIEGIAQGEALHPIQKSFIEHGAIQCGFCTPGMILTAQALFDENPTPSKEEIKMAISGNFCRCTGYNKILNAIADVPSYRKGGC